MLPTKYLPVPISLGILYFQMILVISKQNLIIYFHALIAKSKSIYRPQGCLITSVPKGNLRVKAVKFFKPWFLLAVPCILIFVKGKMLYFIMMLSDYRFGRHTLLPVTI